MEHVLSVVVINHRSHPLVHDCLRSLLAGSLVPDEIVIVDNEAQDMELLHAFTGDARVRLVSRADNPGYAASCNAGAAAAVGDTLLFLNADVTVEPETLERCLVELTRDPAVAVVTPRLVRPGGDLDHACHRGLPTAGASLAYKLRLHRLAPASRRLGRYTMSWLDPLTDHDVEACSGAFLLVGRADLESVGGWDERYRFYAEDLDLCLRLARAGRHVRYLGTVTATHRKGAFSHYATPDEELDPSQRAVKRRVRHEVMEAHRLFYEEHVRASTDPLTRAAVRVMFTLQSMRLDASDRQARI